MKKMKKNIDFKDFDQAYAQLNEEQKEAVDSMYGPVLVIAGPGTGKTELLAVRVGKILRQGVDIAPYNILCLTFTEAGANAMRSRLLKYIGPEAYQVGIFTYHGFSNHVISANPEYFGHYRNLQALSDLERIEIIESIINDLPNDHIMKRLTRNIYQDLKDLGKLFDNMKRENWTELDFEKAHHDQISRLKSDAAFYYKRNGTIPSTGRTYKKGDLKEDLFNTELAKYEKTLQASYLLNEYNNRLRKMERFDFNDMILWTLKAFRENNNLLADYQERYQFILLDEYQDTNGAQNQLIFTLADYWENPNLFAVGDDDQAIFRFQGASMTNIVDFKNKYNPKIIVLKSNYRSYQPILEAASHVIDYNEERLINSEADLTKDLFSKRDQENEIHPCVSIKRYFNIDQEETGIVNEIKKLKGQGIDYKDIAIIYKEHKDAEDLIKYFTLKQIPLKLQRKVDSLQIPVIRMLINMLEYTVKELENPHASEEMLFEILHYSFFNIMPLDVAKLSIYINRNRYQTKKALYWREVISDRNVLEEAMVSNPAVILKCSKIIEGWLTDYFELTLQNFIEKVADESGWLSALIFAPDKGFYLQAFNTVFQLAKEEAAKNKNYSTRKFLEALDKMKTNGLSLPVIQSIQDQEGITFTTVHNSKGLEFDHVFLIKATQDKWVKSKTGNFKFPDTLIPSTGMKTAEDDRRLFYVAMTRAKDTLTITYHTQNAEDKDKQVTGFVYETGLDIPISPENVDQEWIEEYLFSKGRRVVKSAHLIDKDITQSLIQDFKLSPTGLNKYLKCPLTFYFENILRVPMARTVSFGFGNAIHYALENYFSKLNNVMSSKGSLLPVEELIQFFEKGMNIYHSHFTALQFQNHLVHGREILKEYYHTYSSEWLLPLSYKLEHVVDDVVYFGVPIKGKLDKMVLYKDRVEVVDYKTGRYISSKLKPPQSTEEEDHEKKFGGDYWRQLVFYKILLDSDKKYHFRQSEGVMDFIEKDNNNKYNRKSLKVDDFQESLVREQILLAYQGITQLHFDGCGKEECRWCHFVDSTSVNKKAGDG